MENLPASIQESISILSQNIKLLAILYVISVGFMYFQFFAFKNKFMMPGDYYTIKGPRRIYVPFGGSILLTIFLFILLKTNLGYWVFAFVSIFVVYKIIYKKGF